MGLRLLTPPASAGVQWVREGLANFFKQPMGFASLFVMFLLAAQLLGLIPVVGSPLALMMVPLLGLAYMCAGLRTARGQLVQPQVFAEPWRQGPLVRRHLLQLCALYMLACVLSILMCDVLDGGEFNRQLGLLSDAMAKSQDMEQLAVSPAIAQGMLMRLIATTLVGLPFWHAPALVLWGQQSVAQALFSSTIALWRAKAAFTMFGLAWAGVMVGATAFVALLSGVLGGGLTMLAVVPLGIAMIGAFQASLYPTYRDCFGEPESA